MSEEPEVCVIPQYWVDYPWISGDYYDTLKDAAKSIAAVLVMEKYGIYNDKEKVEERVARLVLAELEEALNETI